MVPHSLHLTFLPTCSSDTFTCLPQSGHAITKVVAIGGRPMIWMRFSIGPESPRMQAGMSRLLVSVATYNERENVPRLIEEIHRYAPGADVLVVDDNSPDGTGRVVDELAVTDPRVKPYHRPGKLGLGTAIVAAMRYAMANDYDLLLNMDADFSHPPRYIPAILAGMATRD